MRRNLSFLSLVILIAVSAFAGQERAIDSAPSVERLRAHVTYLASDKLEGRKTGSRGADLAAEYIAREFSRVGLKRSVGIDRPGMSILEADSPRRYMQEFPFVAGVEPGKENVTDVKRREAQTANVVGILEGSDPKLKNEAVVIGAHYDHLGLGGAGSLAAREAETYYGADDNASGVAGMLELARIFYGARLKRTLIFIAFSGEEEGLLGSNYYVNHPVVPLAQTVAMINLDMIGRMKDDKLIVGGIGTAQEWRALVEKINDPVSVPGAADPKDERRLSLRRFALTLNEDGHGPSDHASFYSKQVPVLFFWTGTHEDYHKPSDTADKINYEDAARTVSFIADIARSVGEGERRPTYTVAKSESTGRSMGFRVYLGTIPNYADSTTGLLLDGVRDDSPASRAGLKAGDRIVRMAGRDVRNVYDYTSALGEMKAGEMYEVEAVRAGQTLKLKITPAVRK